MGKYDDTKQTFRNEHYEIARKIRVQNTLCDIASEIAELKYVLDSFLKIYERPKPKCWFKKILKWGKD